MTRWLMLQDEIDRLEALFERIDATVPVFDTEEETTAESKEDEPVDIVSGVALIKIEGVLTPKRIRWLDYFGEKQTVYSDIERKTREAESRGAEKIIYHIDSPGGDLRGLYEAMSVVGGVGVPTETVSGYLLASAAYMIASQTGSITAKNDASLVGSVGVATTRLNWDAIKEISNTDSPKKRPDVSTSRGVKAVQEELDDIYQVFAEMIADGRSVSVSTVKKKFGEGAVMTARTAKRRGMIDAIQVNQPKPAKTAAETGVKMDAKTLREEHREVYDAVFEAGVKAERDRVSAHLVAADGGDIQAAHEAIKGGEPYSDLIKAKHDSFARNQALIKARQDDNPPDVNTAEPVAQDERLETKKGLEAAVPGLTWEVM